MNRQVRAVIRVSSGNFLEMYDFMVFGYYAAAIGRAFFPSGNEFASLMLSLMTFGAGFLMRPLGAIVLGAYTDRHGRRAGLVLTLSLMSIGMLSIALTPGYATIGAMLNAPVGTVKTLVFRAKQQLKVKIAAALDPAGRTRSALQTTQVDHADRR